MRPKLRRGKLLACERDSHRVKQHHHDAAVNVFRAHLRHVDLPWNTVHTTNCLSLVAVWTRSSGLSTCWVFPYPRRCEILIAAELSLLEREWDSPPVEFCFTRRECTGDLRLLEVSKQCVLPKPSHQTARVIREIVHSAQPVSIQISTTFASRCRPNRNTALHGINGNIAAHFINDSCVFSGNSCLVLHNTCTAIRHRCTFIVEVHFRDFSLTHPERSSPSSRREDPQTPPRDTYVLCTRRIHCQEPKNIAICGEPTTKIPLRWTQKMTCVFSLYTHNTG